MNNKGFGFIWLFVFIIIIFVVSTLAYSFLNSIINSANPNNLTNNYNNEYSKYYKDGILITNITNDSNSQISQINYKDIENRVKDSARNYVEDNYNMNENDILYVKVSSLLSSGYLNLYSNNNCTGYIKVEKITGINNYDVYIKCNGYKTYGYLSRFDS